MGAAFVSKGCFKQNFMIKLFFLIHFIIMSFAAISQQKFTISGTIKDAATNEALIGANTVEVSSFKGTGQSQKIFTSI